MSFNQISRTALDFGKAFGWSRSHTGVFGLFEGYFFILIDVRGAKLLLTPLNNGDFNEPFKNALSELESEKAISRFEFRDNSLAFRFNETIRETKGEKIREALTRISSLMKSCGVPTSGSCRGCGKSTSIKFYFFSSTGEPTLLCDDCLKQIDINIKSAQSNYLTEEKFYGRGFVCALIGSILGASVWIWVVSFFPHWLKINGVAMIFGFSLAYSGQIGYSIGKGRIGKKKKWVILATNLLGWVIASIGAVVVAKILKGPIPENFFGLLIRDTAVWVKLKKQLLLTGLSSGLFWVLLFYKNLKESEFPSIKPAIPCY